MGQRGRKSSAELSTVVVDAGPRMPSSPPPELTDAQATVWRDVVGSLPDDWCTRAALSAPSETWQYYPEIYAIRMIAHLYSWLFDESFDVTSRVNKPRYKKGQPR